MAKLRPDVPKLDSAFNFKQAEAAYLEVVFGEHHMRRVPGGYAALKHVSEHEADVPLVLLLATELGDATVAVNFVVAAANQREIVRVPNGVVKGRAVEAVSGGAFELNVVDGERILALRGSAIGFATVRLEHVLKETLHVHGLAGGNRNGDGDRAPVWQRRCRWSGVGVIERERARLGEARWGGEGAENVPEGEGEELESEYSNQNAVESAAMLR